MRKLRLIIGTLIMTSIGLTSCSLPHDERYRNIDKVLSDIDYQNIGTIVHEEIDNGDGVFIASYKKIYYKDDTTFNVIVSKLQNPPDDVLEDCSKKKNIERQQNFSCNYYGMMINVGKVDNKKDTSMAVIEIADTSSGR